DLVASLKTVIAHTTDPQVKSALEAQLAKAEGPPPRPAASPADEVRRTDAAWRDAGAKHDLAVKAVQRLRGQLDQAEEKDRQAAKVLARATIAKSQAAQTLAKAEGAIITDSSMGDLGQKFFFQLSGDTDLFVNMDQLECEKSEKDALAQLEKDLVSTKDTLKSKEEEVQARLRRAAELKEAQPSAKQKAEQVAEEAERERRVESEAEKLSKVKFAATQANQQMTSGNGKKSNSSKGSQGK
ncbi:unnamed protein product, partial [Prorocentrum cordatum]